MCVCVCVCLHMCMSVWMQGWLPNVCVDVFPSVVLSVAGLTDFNRFACVKRDSVCVFTYVCAFVWMQRCFLIF